MPAPPRGMFALQMEEIALWAECIVLGALPMTPTMRVAKDELRRDYLARR